MRSRIYFPSLFFRGIGGGFIFLRASMESGRGHILEIRSLSYFSSAKLTRIGSDKERRRRERDVPLLFLYSCTSLRLLGIVQKAAEWPDIKRDARTSSGITKPFCVGWINRRIHLKPARNKRVHMITLWTGVSASSVDVGRGSCNMLVQLWTGFVLVPRAWWLCFGGNSMQFFACFGIFGRFEWEFHLEAVCN